MKGTKWFFCMLVIALILVSTTSIIPQDWPQWRGTNRDGKVTGFTAPENWPIKVTQKWQVNVGTGDATPALVGEKLYVFVRQDENEVTLCLSAIDGKELWRDQYPVEAITGPASRHPGPRSSPAVANNKVITLGVRGTLSCLDASSGKVLWRKDPFPGVVPTFYTAMSPMISDAMCIAHLGGAGNGALIAYDLKTGDEKWRWDGEGPDYASPVLLTVEGTKQVVTLTEKSIVGVNLVNGKLLWQIPFVPQRRAYNAATPIVAGQTVIFTGAARGTKAVKIEKQADGFSANELWSNEEVAVQFNTPVLKEDLLYGLTDKGYLFCVDAQTGRTAWQDTTRQGQGGFAAILNVGPVMMALPNNSELMVYKPSGKEYQELDRLKVADTATYAHPVISGNRIYVKDEATLTLWIVE